jgi:hypothetical protein
LLAVFLDNNQITELPISESLNVKYMPDSQNYCPMSRIKPFTTKLYKLQNCANLRIILTLETRVQATYDIVQLQYVVLVLHTSKYFVLEGLQ